MKLSSKASKQLVPFLSRANFTHRLLSTATAKDIPVLRKVFDDQQYWHKLNATNYKSSDLLSRLKNSPAETGLFENPYLTSPQGLRKFCRHSLTQANELVETMRHDRSPRGYVNYIANLDRLSDILCRVIDLAEFIRASHPDPHFVQAAQDCHEEMFEIMNVLNTDVALCDILKHVLTDPTILSELSPEEIKVGKILLEDFEKSGIYMNPEVREQFIALSQQISVVGQDFINNTEYVRSNYIKVKVEELNKSGINKIVLNQLSKDIKGQHYKIPTFGYIPYSILRSCPDDNIRMKVWSALHSCSEKQIGRLDQLIKLRSVLANIMGKKSFAHYQLEGKMAKTPEYVRGFMQSLIDATKPKAAEELKFIADLKAKHVPGNKPAESMHEILEVVKPWDRDFYGSVHALQQRRPFNNEQISSYFSLGVVIQGLSNLFKQIYGIYLEPVVPKTGETWSPEVRRINVVSEKEGVIGVVYCDLFERQGKTANPAHFTVCCSRQIYDGETNLSTIQVGQNSKGEQFQLPVISLVCNFSPTTISQEQSICLLQLSEIETLFHEMGHAMHSMLGRTKLQNISGTRCATDFVELPSILMEHFARDHRVLQRMASHYSTGESIPEQLLFSYQSEVKFLQHAEAFSQAKMAILDQELHGESIMKEMQSLDIVKLYHNLERQLEVLSDDKSNWCGRFGHLFGYGATYYSYLFDRAIASKIWQHLFANDPFCRRSGEKFKNSVLKWGGSRDPWECIADALDKSELSKGDKNAMQFIGDTQDL